MKRNKKASATSKSSSLLNEQTVSRQVMHKMKHKYHKARVDTYEKGIPVVSIHAKASKTQATSGAVAVASRPQPSSTSAQGQRTSAAAIHQQKPNAVAVLRDKVQLLPGKAQSYGKIGNKSQLPLNLTSISKEGATDARGGAALASLGSARPARDGASSRENALKQNQLIKQQKLFAQYKVNNQGSKEPMPKVQDQSGVVQQEAYHSTPAGDQQHHVYMKKRMARRSRNAAARKSLSQNTADFGHATCQIAGVEGQLGPGGKVIERTAAGRMVQSRGGDGQEQIRQRSPETDHPQRRVGNFSYQDGAPSQSSLVGHQVRTGMGVVMQYQNMLIGDQSAGHLTQITSSNYSKSYTRQTNQTAGKESQTGKSVITNPSGRENVIETTQNDDPASSYRQSSSALRNFSNADLSANTVVRRGHGPNSRKNANAHLRGEVQHLTVFNQRFPQADSRAGHQSQLQFRTLNQRLQNEGRSSYEDARRTTGAEELIQKQLPSLPNTRGRNTVNRSHFTQQQAPHVPIRSVNIGLTENPSSSGGGPTNNIDRHSSSLLTIGLPSAASHAGVPPVLHVKGSKEQPEAGQAAQGMLTSLNVVNATDVQGEDNEQAEPDEQPNGILEISNQRDDEEEAKEIRTAEDQVAAGTGQEARMMEESRRRAGGRAHSGGHRKYSGRNQAGKSRSQAAQSAAGGGLTSTQNKFQKYQLMKDSILKRQRSYKAAASDSSDQVNQQTFLSVNSQSHRRGQSPFAAGKIDGGGLVDGHAEERAGPGRAEQVRASEQRPQTWSKPQQNFLIGGLGTSDFGSSQISTFAQPGEAPRGANFRRIIPQKNKGPNGGAATAQTGAGPSLLGQNAQIAPQDGRGKLHDMFRKKNFRIQREQSLSLKRRNDSSVGQDKEVQEVSISLGPSKEGSDPSAIHQIGAKRQQTADDEDEKQAINLENVGKAPTGGSRGHPARPRPEGTKAEELGSCYGDDEVDRSVGKASRKKFSSMKRNLAGSPRPRAPHQLVSRSQSRHLAQTLLEVNSQGAQSQAAAPLGAGPHAADGCMSQGRNTTLTGDLSQEGRVSLRSKVSQLSIKTNVSLKKRRRQIQQQFNLQRMNCQLQEEPADSNGGKPGKNDGETTDNEDTGNMQAPHIVIENQEGVQEGESHRQESDRANPMTFNSRPADDVEEGRAYGAHEGQSPAAQVEGVHLQASPPNYYPAVFNEKAHYKYIEGISNQIGGFNERPESLGSFRSSSQFSNTHNQNPNQDESLFEALAASVVNKPQDLQSASRDREPMVLQEPLGQRTDNPHPRSSGGRASEGLGHNAKTIGDKSPPYYYQQEQPGADSVERRAASRPGEGGPSSDSIRRVSSQNPYAQRMVDQPGSAEPNALTCEGMTSAAVPSAAAATRSAQDGKLLGSSQHFFRESRCSRPIPDGSLAQSSHVNPPLGLRQPKLSQFAADDAPSAALHPYGSASRESQASQGFRFGLEAVESQQPLCQGIISASERQRGNLETSTQEDGAHEPGHARVKYSVNCKRKVSDKTSVQQFTSIFNDIRMSSSKDSFKTSLVSENEYKNTNTGNFNQSNTLDSAENGPLASVRQMNVVQQDSHETLHHPNAQQQEEQMDKYIDLTLVDPEIPLHTVNQDEMLNSESQAAADAGAGAQREGEASFQVQQVVQESNMRFDCMNTTEEEEEDDEDQQSLRTFQQQQAYESQQFHFQQHEPSRFSSRHQLLSHRQSSSCKKGANHPFGNDRTASKFGEGHRYSEQEQEGVAYRQTTTEQSQIMFEQRELVNRDVCFEGQQRERDYLMHDDENDEEGEDEILSRRIHASPLESPHTATGGLVYEKNSGGTMIKMQKPSEGDPDYLRRIIASSSDNCGGIHSKLESFSGITAIHKQNSRQDSLILLQQSQKIGADSNTYDKQREAILNQRDNANRSRHFFSACDGHLGPPGHVFSTRSPKENPQRRQGQPLTKLKQKSMNKNVKSMQIDNSIENQYYISSQSPGRRQNKRNIALEDNQQLHYYNKGNLNLPKVSGETPARTSNDRQRSNGSKIYVQSNLMSLLSGENNNQMESINEADFQDAVASHQTPMNKKSDFDQSNIESSNETSNNIGQNLLNQSSILSGTKASMGRHHRLHPKRTISSKGHGGGADDDNSQAMMSIDLCSQNQSRNMDQTAIKNRSLQERLRGENEEAVELEDDEFMRMRASAAVGHEGQARASSGFEEGCRSLAMTEYQNKRSQGRLQDGGRAGSSSLTVIDNSNTLCSNQAAIVSRYRVRQVPVSNTPKRLRNISSSQKKSSGGTSGSDRMRDSSSIKAPALQEDLRSLPVHNDGGAPRAKYADPADSPGQKKKAAENINFYKNGSAGFLSQEQSLSPSALPTPQLSIQQDSQKRNVYHIFGKESKIDLKNQKHTSSSLSQQHNSVVAKKRHGGRVTLFESINQYDQEPLGQLTPDGASTCDGVRAKGKVQETAREGMSARTGLVGKQNCQVDGSDQQAANHPRRKLLFSLGQQNLNQNLMKGAAVFNDANSMVPAAKSQQLRRDQRVKKFKMKSNLLQAPLEDHYINPNGADGHTASKNQELLHSSTTVLEMSEINQGVQYDQRGRGIKSTQSGPSQHGRAGRHKKKVARRTYDASGAYNEQGSYFSAQNNTLNVAPSDIHYQFQTRDVDDGLLDRESRMFATDERSAPGQARSSLPAGHGGSKRNRKAKPKNIYGSQLRPGQFESRSAERVVSSSVVVASADTRAKEIHGSRGAQNLNRVITRGFQESSLLEPNGALGRSGSQAGSSSPRTYVIEPEFATDQGQNAQQNQHEVAMAKNERLDVLEGNQSQFQRGSRMSKPLEKRGNGEMLCQESISLSKSPEKQFQSRFHGARILMTGQAASRDQTGPLGAPEGRRREGAPRHHFLRRLNQSEGRQTAASQIVNNDDGLVNIGAGVSKAIEPAKLASVQRNRILTFRSTERYLNQASGGPSEPFGRTNKRSANASQDETSSLAAWCCMNSKSRNNSQESLAANRSVGTAGAAQNSDSKSSVCSVF